VQSGWKAWLNGGKKDLNYALETLIMPVGLDIYNLISHERLLASLDVLYMPQALSSCHHIIR
jgi:hypothetical protein